MKLYLLAITDRQKTRIAVNAREASSEPIACRLAAGAYQERLAWIAELNRSALQSARREDARLILIYDPRVAVRVREMIRRERECCTSLAFELYQDEHGLNLAITAPQVARDALDALFDPFLTGARVNVPRGCTDAVPSTRGNRGAAVAASAAGVAAAGALACAACCILPFALPAAALAVTGGALAWLASVYKGAIVAAIALVATAWVWVVWQSLRTRKPPAAATALVMATASVMLGLAYSWPTIEPLAVAAFNAR